MKKMVIKKKDVFYFLLYLFIIIPFFKIPYLSVIIPQISTIYKIFMMIAFVLVILLLLKSRTFSKFELVTIVFFVLLFFSTILNSGDLKQCVALIMSSLTLTFVIRHGLKNNTKVFINSFEFLLYSIVFINFLSVLFFPNGMYASDSISFYTTNNWFLGFKNNHVIFIIPAILISFINSYYTHKKISIRTIFLLIISIMTLILVKSATSLIGVLLISILLIYNDLKKESNFINVKSFISTYLGMFFIIVIFRLQELFKFLIVDILHKDISLSGRIYIWDYVIEFIKNKPVLGYGIEEPSIRYYKTNFIRSFHAHNQILEVLYEVGFLGFILLVYNFYLSMRELNRYKYQKCSKVILIVIFSYLIMMLTEAYSLENIFMLLTFGYNVKYLIKMEEKDESK